MHKLIFLGLIFNITICHGQNVIEVEQPELNDELEIIFTELKASRDSSFYTGIEILEEGLEQVDDDYGLYKIALNLGFLYTQTKQFGKCLDMWNAANKKGICFDFRVGDNFYPSYLSAYRDNSRFIEFIASNDSLLAALSIDAKADYFVKLPLGYDKSKKYPVIIILHGGVGTYYRTYENWKSDFIDNDFVSVYAQGREIKGSFARGYGKNGISDIEMIYKEVIENYSVDTTSLVLAGQSAGGGLSLRLINNNLLAKGIFLAFPTKPKDFDIQKAKSLQESSVRVVMICGEQDKRFYPGQLEIFRLLDSVEVENKFIKYPNLGHEFPNDFDSQLDQGLNYILDNE